MTSAAFSVSGTTQLYGLMGYPVTHSLSPLMHTTAFHYYHLDCLYVPFPVLPEQLPHAVSGAVALGICGFNVTIPHKEAILSLLDTVSAEARFVGAVNTVHIVEGRTIGYNTDGKGFLEPLKALALPLADMPALVLGAGGAARAITMALLQAGCPMLSIANRTYERGARLAVELQQQFPAARIGAVALDEAARVAGQSRLVVNATAVGLRADAGALLPASCFGPQQVVYDIVYRPLYTPLLQAARRRGATVIPGIEMLLGQGAEAFRLWTGCVFPEDVVRKAVYAVLTRPPTEEQDETPH